MDKIRAKFNFDRGSAVVEASNVIIVRSLSAKYRPDRYRPDKSVKFGTELP